MSEVNYQLGFKIHDNGLIERFNLITNHWEEVEHDGFIEAGTTKYSVDALVYSSFRGKYAVQMYENSEFTHLDDDPNNYDISNIHLVEKIKEPDPVIVPKHRGRKANPETKKIKIKKEKVKKMKGPKKKAAITWQEALSRMSVADDGTPMVDGVAKKISINTNVMTVAIALPAELARALGTVPAMSVARFNVLVKYKDKIASEDDLKKFLKAKIRKLNPGWMNNEPSNIYVDEFKPDIQSEPTFEDIFGNQYAEHPIEEVKPVPQEPVSTQPGRYTVPIPLKVCCIGTECEYNNQRFSVWFHEDSGIAVRYIMKSPLTGEDLEIQEVLPEDTIVSITY